MVGHLEEEGPLDCEESPEEEHSVPGSSQKKCLERKKKQKTSVKTERP